MKIDTFALSGAGLVNKNTNPVILVPSPGANKYNVPVSIQVYKSQSGSTRVAWGVNAAAISIGVCLLYTSPSPRDRQKSRMPSSA